MYSLLVKLAKVQRTPNMFNIFSKFLEFVSILLKFRSSDRLILMLLTQIIKGGGHVFHIDPIVNMTDHMLVAISTSHNKIV